MLPTVKMTQLDSLLFSWPKDDNSRTGSIIWAVLAGVGAWALVFGLIALF